jgi:hypothetical protein
MGIVIAFLTLLVFLMLLMSGAVKKIEERRSAKTENAAAAGPQRTEELPHALDSAGRAGADGDSAGRAEPEVAAALAAFLRDGGTLPAAAGRNREDVAAVLAALTAVGARVPRASRCEVAAAVAAAYHRVNN